MIRIGLSAFEASWLHIFLRSVYRIGYGHARHGTDGRKAYLSQQYKVLLDWLLRFGSALSISAVLWIRGCGRKLL
jgi:hypothetical protein